MSHFFKKFVIGKLAELAIFSQFLAIISQLRGVFLTEIGDY